MGARTWVQSLKAKAKDLKIVLKFALRKRPWTPSPKRGRKKLICVSQK